ncbi:MAG: nuclear transport factor 2 family protein [Sphingopyxis sp.]
MRTALLAATLVVAVPATAKGEVGSLTDFADAFDAAQIAKDGAALQRMVADDLVFIDGNGKRSGKAEFIADWTGGGDSYDPVTLHDRIVMPLGENAGLASAETVLSGRSEGKPFRVRIRFTDIFRRSTDGGWQAAYIHVTRMPVDSGG